MVEDLQRLSRVFLETKNSSYRRYLIQTARFSQRLQIIIGPRGVGKTTTLIQALLDFVEGDRFDSRILYVQADHFLVGSSSLYEIAEQFHITGGKWIAFDEIHKYPEWSKDLKSIYDTFPGLTVLASGSSALDIHRGSHDLSRRALLYRMQGMSFREYLELVYQPIKLPTHTLDDICVNHERITDRIIKTLENVKVVPAFHKYLHIGYYPYFFALRDESAYKMTLEQNIRTTIESDLSAVYPTLTGVSMQKIKQLLVFIASAVPFTPNWKTMQSVLQVSDARTLKAYFAHLEDAGLIRTVAKASSKLVKLEAPSKIYLDNPNQLHAISQAPDKGTARETFFLNMLSAANAVTLPMNGDFQVGQRVFEVGGKSKKLNQIKNVTEGFLACDDIEMGVGAKIPLWLFGFLY